MYIGLAAWSEFFVKCFYWSGSVDHQNGGNEREEKEAVVEKVLPGMAEVQVKWGLNIQEQEGIICRGDSKPWESTHALSKGGESHTF